MKLPILLALAAAMLPAAENTITSAERSAGWKLLFDGRTMKGWKDPAKNTPPGDSWEIKDGCLATRLKPRISEDLITQETYKDFDLKFDWKVSERGNTGLKYRIQRILFVERDKDSEGSGRV